MTNTNIDNFKTYEGYENMYIIDSYIRYLDYDTVFYSTTDGVDAMDYMDNNNLWEDCYIYYIDENGIATYPEF